MNSKPDTKPRNTDRHKPGYMSAYMRQWRADKKAAQQKLLTTTQQ